MQDMVNVIKRMKIPQTTKVTLEGKKIIIVGPKGELRQTVDKDIIVKVEDSEFIIERNQESKRLRALHGLTQALLRNMIAGVTVGFTKTLELSGVGFRAQTSDDTLTLSVGFSHPVVLKAPQAITFAVAENKITVSGIDKQLVGQIAQNIRNVRPPEPYKGKGIRYEGERIRRKAGKAAAKTVGAK